MPTTPNVLCENVFITKNVIFIQATTVHWDTLFSGSGAYQLIYSGLITVSHTYFISEKKYDTKKSGKHIECVRGAEKSVKVKSVRYHEKTGTNKMRQCTVL